MEAASPEDGLVHDEDGATLDPLTGKDVYREEDGTLWEKTWPHRLVRHGGKFADYPVALT